MSRKVEFIESYIKFGTGDYQWNDNHGELIRCENCKHCDTDTLGHCWCMILAKSREPDWFCADGEKKET